MRLMFREPPAKIRTVADVETTVGFRVEDVNVMHPCNLASGSRVGEAIYAVALAGQDLESAPVEVQMVHPQPDQFP